MISRDALQNLSSSGQLLLDIDPDIIEELITIIKAANIVRYNDRLMILVELDAALELHKIVTNRDCPIMSVSYQRFTQLFDIWIFREIISLTLDDLRKLADMPIT